MMNKFWRMGLMAVLLLAAACGGQNRQPTPTMVPTPLAVEKPVYTVERGLVEEIVQLSGRVAPRQQQDLYFRADGFVKEVLVENGAWVKKGDVLARLDEPEKYQADVAAAELAAEQAKIKLEEARLNAPVLAAQAKIDLLAAQIALQKAKNERAVMGQPRVTDHLRLEQMRGDLAAAQKSLQEAQSAFDAVADRPEGDGTRQAMLQNLVSARQAYDRALANLNWAEGKGTEMDISLADAQVALAQANYEKAQAEAQRWEADGGAALIHLAELVLKDAETRLALAQKTMENIELLAAFDGQVLSLSIVPGSQVRAFQAVATLADPAELLLMAIPTTEDLLRLAIGMPAMVRLSSRQGEEFNGEVIHVPLDLTVTSGPGGGNLAVLVTLNEGNQDLKLGDAATILIKTDERRDVLWLPPAAIRSFQGQDFVFVESGGVQRRVNVVLGLKTNHQVEIVSGLEEGQKVIGQ